MRLDCLETFAFWGFILPALTVDDAHKLQETQTPLVWSAAEAGGNALFILTLVLRHGFNVWQLHDGASTAMSLVSNVAFSKVSLLSAAPPSPHA